MPWNLLLFPLLGGFLFIHICHFYRYRSKRIESERLLLQSASCGIVLLMLGRLATFYLRKFSFGMQAHAFMDQVVPQQDAPYLGTAIGALIIGWAGAHSINLLFLLIERLPIQATPLKLRIVKRYDNGLLKMFHEAMYMDRPVSVTLSSRKVYIGYVAEPPTDSPHDSYFTLLLLISGYRDAATLTMTTTINYADKMAIEDQQTEDPLMFFITLSMADILSANFFDERIYEQHFTGRQMLL